MECLLLQSEISCHCDLSELLMTKRISMVLKVPVSTLHVVKDHFVCKYIGSYISGEAIVCAFTVVFVFRP